MEDLYEIVRTHGTTRLFRLQGIEDAWFVGCVINGAETHLYAGSRDKAERTFAYYADGVKNRPCACEQTELF